MNDIDRPDGASLPAHAGAERAIRVMAVDDDPMVLDLIRVMLKAAPGIELVATATR